MLGDITGNCKGQGSHKGESFPGGRVGRGSLQSLEPSPTLLVGNKPRVRSIRFAAGHDAEGSQSHVHFDEKLHDSVVMVTQESDSSFLVKVCVCVCAPPPPPPRHQPYSLLPPSQPRLASWACLLPTL